MERIKSVKKVSEPSEGPLPDKKQPSPLSQESELDERGPVPAPYSAEHAARVPELSRRGAMKSFFHDRGMGFGSPEWLVQGAVESDDRLLLKRVRNPCLCAVF